MAEPAGARHDETSRRRGRHEGDGAVRFRYQYLAGGVNTGNGWATWNPDGEFARYYIEESVANGIIPVFTYYMMFQSRRAAASEGRVYNNLNNTGTMTAYYNDLKLFFQRAGAFPDRRSSCTSSRISGATSSTRGQR